MGNQSTTSRRPNVYIDIVTAPGVQVMRLVPLVSSRVLALLSVQRAAASGSTGSSGKELKVPGYPVTSQSNAVSGQNVA